MAVSWKYSDENVPQAWAAEGNQSQVSRLLRGTSSPGHSPWLPTYARTGLSGYWPASHYPRAEYPWSWSPRPRVVDGTPEYPATRL